MIQSDGEEKKVKRCGTWVPDSWRAAEARLESGVVSTVQDITGGGIEHCEGGRPLAKSFRAYRCPRCHEPFTDLPEVVDHLKAVCHANKGGDS